MNRAGAWIVPLLLAAAVFARGETPAVQRYWADLRLGDTLEEIQRIYPPAQEWPSRQEPRSGVTRWRVERAFAKSFPADVDTLWLGLRHGRLVEIQFIYDERFSSRKTADLLAEDLGLIYGEPRRSDSKFWWGDGRTILRVFTAEVPAALSGKEGQPSSPAAAQDDAAGSAAAEGGRSVVLRTSVQIMESGLLRRRD